MIYRELELNLDYVAMGLEEPPETARLVVYAASPSVEYCSMARPAIVLCPGGGYAMTSDREAEPIALALVARGIQVFLLRYAVNPARYPVALIQVAATLALARERAEEFNVDPDRIGVAGFSAGGHLAGSLGVFWNKPFLAEALGRPNADFMPNFMLLCYPVISSGEHRHDGSFRMLLGKRHDELHEEMSLEKYVHAGVPQTFLWHTAADPAVPVENSLYFASALSREHIPFDLHIYDRGGHGLSLGNELTMTPDGYSYEEAVHGWLDLFLAWEKRGRK